MGLAVYNFLAAIRFGKLFDVPDSAINTSLEAYVPSNNRSQITVTAKNKLLVDCYNANPSSMQSAINSFIQMDASNKVLILGDMLELGTVSDDKHTEILNYLNEENALYFTVGPLFYELKNNKATQKFLNIVDCISFFQQTNLEDHFVLLKGSRGIALEKLLPHL